MSASLSLAAEDLRALAGFLDAISEATRQGGVRLDPYGPAYVGVGGVTIAIRWNAEAERYELDDRVGD